MRIFMISAHDSWNNLPSTYFLVQDNDDRDEDRIYCDFVRKTNPISRHSDDQHIMDNSIQVWTLRDIDYLSP